MTKKIITKKKVAKKKKVEIKEVVIDAEKYLTESEMLKIDLANKEMKIVELELIAMSHKKKILDLEFDIEIGKKKVSHGSFKEKKEKLLKVLTENYELKSDLNSYDPISGEIKDE
tara:strand:- start:577 stop:921 length:345 start_codon:yes stop_codon:yes gene_type:complete